MLTIGKPLENETRLGVLPLTIRLQARLQGIFSKLNAVAREKLKLTNIMVSQTSLFKIP